MYDKTDILEMSKLKTTRETFDIEAQKQGILNHLKIYQIKPYKFTIFTCWRLTLSIIQRTCEIPKKKS